MAIEIIYETHSLTTDNEAGIATGWLPGQLSERGRQLARELGRRRRDQGIAAVFVSDLARAVQTAEIAFEGSGIAIYQDARLRECDYGDLNGMPTTRLAAERARHINEPYPGGQSYRQVIDATRDYLRDLAAGWDGQRVVVIAHSANKWALDCLLAGFDIEELVDAPFNWQEGWHYVLPTGWEDVQEVGATREHELIQLLTERGVRFKVHEHVVSRTVADAQAYLPFPTEQLLKTIVFRVKRGPWLLVACRGQDRVDYRKLAAACGVKREEIVRPPPEEIEATLGVAIGGVCPIAPDGSAQTIVDATAAATLDTVYCGIGRNDRTLEIGIADLVAVADARVLPVVMRDA